MNPIFDIRKENYYLALWFVGNNAFDVLAVAWRTPDNHWHGTVRFRHHVDDKIFDSDDLKQSWSLEPKLELTEQQMFDNLSVVMSKFANNHHIPVQIIEGRCMGDQFIDKMCNGGHDWMHVKTIKLNKNKQQKESNAD